MMLNDTKFLLIFGITSTVFLTFCSIWLVLFVFLFTIATIYYDFNHTSDVRGHALKKVNSALNKVRQFITQTFNSVVCDSYNLPSRRAQTVTTMFTNSAWDNKRTGVVSPMHRRGSVTTVMGKHTSTPIRSPIYKGADLTCNSSVIKPNICRRPDRYSLSDTSFNSDLNSSATASNAPGPLSSSRYNIGMGMYAETKSPGLSSRVVQYSGDYDRSRDRITHLPQYGRPGLFPNVNLNKSPKLVKPVSQRSVTVRIAPPDASSMTEVERSSILSNSFKSVGSPQETSPAQSEISTRSVLDALKEISRKRIHARDEIIDQNKRHKKMSSPTRLEQTTKRGWDNNDTNPEQSNSPSTPTAKKHKQAAYEDIISSLSSSVHLREQYANKRKLASKDSPENNNVKQIKFKSPNHIKIPNVYYDKSTQEYTTEVTPKPPSPVTTPARSPTPPPKTTPTETTPVSSNVCRLKFIANPPEKENDIFVPFKPPTEEFKKKRLAALLGAISGADWDIKDLTKKFYPDAKDDAPIKSILSPPKTGVTKKNVTFDIPKVDVTSTSNSITQSISSTGSLTDLPPKISDSSNAIASTSSEINLAPSKGLTSLFGNGLPPKVGDINSEITKTTSVPSFEIGCTTAASTPSITSTSGSSLSTTGGLSTTDASTIKFGVNNISKPSSATTVSAPTFSVISTATPTFGITTTTSSNPPTLTFGTPNDSKVAPPSTINAPVFSTTAPSITTSSATPSLGATPTFGIKSTPVSTISNISSSPFGTTTTTSVVPTFGGFGATNTTTPEFGAAVTTTTTATPLFGGFTPTSKSTVTPITTTSGFGVNTTTSAFGVTNTTTPAFGAPTNTVAPAFGVPTTTSSPSFGGFGVPMTTASVFGGSTNTVVSAFGATTPAFGPTTTANTPAFGATNAVTTPAFGVTTPATTSASTFGAPGGFGATTTTPFGFGTTQTTPAFVGFSAPAVTTASGPAFGGFGGATTTAAPAFGAFGATTTTTSAFGAFGAVPTTNSAFGGFGGTTSTTASGFGGFGVTTSTTASGFGGFGAATTSSNLFGATSTPATTTSAFGVTSPSAFGTPTPSAFGDAKSTFQSPSNLFGTGTAFSAPATSTPSLFGSTAPPAFGSTTSPAFGSTTPAFGSTTTPAFGAPTNATPAFGGASSAPPAFGTATPAFGITTTAPPAFGSSNFASTTTTTANGFSFGGSSFGGAASPPAFSAPAPAATPGVFSFGATTTDSGSSSAFQFGGATKPGGFNFNVGGAQNGGFGGAAPAFTAPAGNMFSIGTSSTAPRPRAATRHKKK